MKKNVAFMVSTLLLFVGAIIFLLVDWSVDGFELLKAQDYQFYFHSWVSLAGLVFSIVMATTTFIIYKKSDITSLKFLSLSFILTSLAYLIIGYHSSYCNVCSDLTMCSASHNYSNSFTIIASILVVLTALLSNLKNNIFLLKLFSFALILASFFMIIILFISIEFMEIPSLMFYEYDKLNLQGFVFVFPMILLALSFLYLKTITKISNLFLATFALLFLSLIPQAYHIFICKECYRMECSEFFLFSGLIMFISIGLLIYAISLQLQEKR